MCKIRNNTIKSIPIFFKNHILIILIFNFTFIILCWFISIPIHWQGCSRVYNDLYKCKEKTSKIWIPRLSLLVSASLALSPPLLGDLDLLLPLCGASSRSWDCLILSRSHSRMGGVRRFFFSSSSFLRASLRASRSALSFSSLSFRVSCLTSLVITNGLFGFWKRSN